MKTKNKWYTASIVFALLLSTSIFSACNNNDDDVVVKSKNIVEIVGSDPNFSFLETAVLLNVNTIGDIKRHQNRRLKVSVSVAKDLVGFIVSRAKVKSFKCHMNVAAAK